MSDRIPKAKIQAILGSIPNPTVVELGAHRGTDTEWLYAACKGKVTYLAVEPDYRHWDALWAICSPRDIRMVSFAVGAANETRHLHLAVTDGVPASSSLRKPATHLDAFPSIGFEKAPVESVVKTLDRLMYVHGVQPDFIWADIQGSEGDMIKGGCGTLRKTKWVYCESYNVEMYAGQMLRPEFLREMSTLGFEVEDEDRDNVLLRNTLLLPPAQDGAKP